MPPLPRGEAIALPDPASADLGDALAPPLGELASDSETERVSGSPLPFFAILRETAQNRTYFVKELETEFTVFSCDKWGTVLSCK
jgi:hypothetical protein